MTSSTRSSTSTWWTSASSTASTRGRARTPAILDMTLTSAACPLTDVIEDQIVRGPQPLVDDLGQLGLDAAVGSGQDHR